MNQVDFTFIYHAWRPEFIPHSLDAIIDQTNPNIQVIVIDTHPAQDSEQIGLQVSQIIKNYAAKDSRVEIISTPFIKLDIRNPLENIEAALKLVLPRIQGKYLLIQNDDDFISKNFVEETVKVFEENSECQTVVSRCVTVDKEGKTIGEKQDPGNRARYMKGSDLALDYLRGGKLFTAPGCSVFVMKKDVFFQHHCPSNAYDLVLMFAIVASGVTGYSAHSTFYWRRHTSQFNVILTAKGFTGAQKHLEMIEKWKIREIWKKVDPQNADEVWHTLRKRQFIAASKASANLLYRFQFRSALRVIRECGGYMQYWVSLPQALYRSFPLVNDPRGSIFAMMRMPVIRPILRYLFMSLPPTKSSSLLHKIKHKLD